jgi:pyruvate,orthophosphate dikinase
MANMGIPVPPGFTITTEVCTDYYQAGGIPTGLKEEVERSIVWLEKTTGKQFGVPENPLLLSVRSGARVSMPGMMDTVLNLGLNDETVVGLGKKSGERFAYDAYRRLIMMFSDVVLGVERHLFEDALEELRVQVAGSRGVDTANRETLQRLVPDSVLPAESLKALVARYHAIVKEHLGRPFPASPMEQLMGAIEAVFKSWNTDRAILYREMHDIPGDWGTAVNVQTMVFGNMGDTSATGVAFTRDPSTGERRFFGEWLPNAQGEDVVAGVRTPRVLMQTPTSGPGESMEEAMPVCFKELFAIQQKLENHFRDMQDIEFTIEDGKLFLLQTRNGKRSARAAVRIAVDMVGEGLLHEDEALLRVEPNRLQELLFPAIDPKSSKKHIAKGLPASPGAVTGKAVFDAGRAAELGEAGQAVILVRTETSPEDLHGMKAALGILTARGGATSHAAVVARGMGRSCVAGCATLAIDDKARQMVAHGPDGSDLCTVKEGDIITIDGSSGRVFVGEVDKIPATLEGAFEQLLAWAGKVRGMRVRANADTPEDARKALSFGAEGIGLCRTEHMFFDTERIAAVREMILSADPAERERALAKILPFQVKDFTELFEVMAGLPVNIRLLDPPLHEFLPHEPEAIEALAKEMSLTARQVKERIEFLAESNPMLGHRGVRLGVTYPAISAMQFHAILEAAAIVKKKGIPVAPEIMIPLAFSLEELELMRSIVRDVATQIFAKHGVEVEYQFGTMIELPRAALLGEELAQVAQFFSFGTNDLTQTTLGISRDDAQKSFLPAYVEEHILPSDPFVTLDRKGVGQLVRMGCENGRKSRPEIKLGVCGEHGGDPDSIEFLDTLGLSYVSCSPFRVPIARLAVAQAALKRLHKP